MLYFVLDSFGLFLLYYYKYYYWYLEMCGLDDKFMVILVKIKIFLFEIFRKFFLKENFLDNLVNF